MGASGKAMTSSSVYSPAFWEWFWRTGGIQSIACFIIAYVIYGDQPRVGAAADTLVAFYNGESHTDLDRCCVVWLSSS